MQEKIDKISPIKKRILQFIELKGISKADFVRNAGMSYENLKGKSLISELAGDKIGKILLFYPEINAEWLLIGNGKILKFEDKNEVNEPAQLYSCRECREKEILINQLIGENNILREQMNLPMPERNKKVSWK